MNYNYLTTSHHCQYGEGDGDAGLRASQKRIRGCKPQRRGSRFSWVFQNCNVLALGTPHRRGDHANFNHNKDIY